MVEAGWYRVLSAGEKATLLTDLSRLQRGLVHKLRSLGIPRSTYYAWQQRYAQSGLLGLTRGEYMARIWNRLTAAERQTVLVVVRSNPDLSCRLLAVKITDEADFSVSESTVYRILKQYGLIVPRPLEDMPAKKEWQHKTKTCDEI